jgi:hypothetical protein
MLLSTHVKTLLYVAVDDTRDTRRCFTRHVTHLLQDIVTHNTPRPEPYVLPPCLSHGGNYGAVAPLQAWMQASLRMSRDVYTSAFFSCCNSNASLLHRFDFICRATSPLISMLHLTQQGLGAYPCTESM